jgi:hypothetical protein
MYNAFRKLTWVLNLSGPNKTPFDPKKKRSSEDKTQGHRKFSLAAKRVSVSLKEQKATNAFASSKVSKLPKLFENS